MPPRSAPSSRRLPPCILDRQSDIHRLKRPSGGLTIISISQPMNKRLHAGTSSPVFMWLSSCGIRSSRRFSSSTIKPAAKPPISAPQKPLEIQLRLVSVVVPICAR